MRFEGENQELETRLLRQRPEADPAFEQSLRRKLIQAFSLEYEPRAASVHIPRMRLGWAVLAAILFGILVFLTPAGRALAQQILEFGIFTISRQPSAAEQVIQEPLDPEEVQQVETLSVELAAASRRAGFNVYIPSFIPAGYSAVDDPPIKLLLNSQGQVTAAEYMLLGPERENVLFFSQHPFPPKEELTPQNLGIGQADIEEVEVGQNQGFWLPNLVWGTSQDASGEPQPVTYSVLIWLQPEADGSAQYFWLGSQAKLSKHVMLQIAGSLRSE